MVSYKAMVIWLVEWSFILYILFVNIHLTCSCLSFVHADKIHCTYTTGNVHGYISFHLPLLFVMNHSVTAN